MYVYSLRTSVVGQHPPVAVKRRTAKGKISIGAPLGVIGVWAEYVNGGYWHRPVGIQEPSGRMIGDTVH
jgi:hypothetical protein